ncbi:TIGR03643 family protein [Francisella uliginis]|uniref:TIGR03643 family protein n=1 Tax=Francisella uliginis TaxID=573570 RepID=A0A1L4BQU0_9GAMM|nr:TIGR03643 family protein [Francisella uliginis]API86209.1 TIGR03643 family protein [Francisella uliginis]
MSDKSITTSEIIEMAWSDKISFDSIKNITGLSESQVIKIMRNNLKPNSFRLWCKRVTGRVAKHKKRLNYTNASSLV